MFRLECFVEDKNLAPVMHLLAGMVRGIEVNPVTNVEVLKNGEMKEQTDGDVLSLLAKYMNEHPGPINSRYLKEFQKSIGRAEKGYAHLLRRAMEEKLLIKNKDTGKRNASYSRVNMK